MKRSRREAWEKPWSAMGREGRRGREPYGAPWSGKGGWAEREGAERAEGVGRAGTL